MLGVSLILVVFIVLCLITFATLAFVLSRTDAQLSKSSAENISQFYEADAHAQETLKKIDCILEENYINTASKEEYIANIQEEVGSLEQVELITKDDSYVLRFVTNMSMHEQLVSKLEILYPVKQSYYKTIEWALESKK